MSALWIKILQLLSNSFGNHPSPPSPVPTPTPSPEPTPAPLPAPSTADEVVEAINQARSSANLAALVVDPAIDRMANAWASTMASGVGLSHGDFAGRITTIDPNTAAGEDIAEGQPDAASVVAAWMASPPHRANILGAFNRIGVGSARDGGGTLYWCADFVQVN